MMCKLKLSGWNCLEVLSDGSSRFVTVLAGEKKHLVKVNAQGFGKMVLHSSCLKDGFVYAENAINISKKRLMAFRAKSLMLKKLKNNTDKTLPLYDQYLALFSSDNNIRWNIDIADCMSNSVNYPKYGDHWEQCIVDGKLKPFQLNTSKSPLVSIVIPTYGRIDLVYRLLLSIHLQDAGAFEYEVIVAEDASESGCHIDKYVSGITLIRNQQNLGFLKNCNQAISHANGEYVVLLNNDTYVTPGWLKELLIPFEQTNQTGLVGGMLLYPNGDIQEAGGIVWNNGQPWNVAKGKDSYHCEYNYTREVDYISGAALCFKKSIWDQVGGFDEIYTPAYYEDTDFAFKVKSLGYKILYTPLCKIIHDEGQTHGTDTSTGIKHYQVLNSKEFKTKWANSFRDLGQEGCDLHLNKDRNVRFRVLFIDATTPEPNKNAGGYAASQEISLFQDLGAKVTFVPENLAYWNEYTQELQRNGVEAIYAPYFYTVEQFIKARINEFDVIYITRHQVASKYLELIKTLKPSLPIVFNNADLHFLREFRHHSNQPDINLDDIFSSRKNELAVINQADAILVYTKEEKAVLESHFVNGKKIYLNPWVLSPKTKADPIEKKGVCFIGGFNHQPNVEAVDWYLNNIAQELYELDPSIVLNIYGPDLPEYLSEKIKNTKNVGYHGYVESLDDVFLENRVFIAPLLSGAGIKGKVLDAMSYGLPCIVSSVASEGIPLVDRYNCFITDSKNEWINAIIELYNDECLLTSMSQSVYELANNNYTRSKALTSYKNMLINLNVYDEAVELDNKVVTRL